jgi:Fur family transcriptional regulator, ferric uptake regulator
VVVEEWADRITAATGFAAVEHTVELSGMRTDCQPRRPRLAESPVKRGLPPCCWESARLVSQDRTRSCVS